MSFSIPDYWVVLAAVTPPGPDVERRFCDIESRDELAYIPLNVYLGKSIATAADPEGLVTLSELDSGIKILQEVRSNDPVAKQAIKGLRYFVATQLEVAKRNSRAGSKPRSPARKTLTKKDLSTDKDTYFARHGTYHGWKGRAAKTHKISRETLNKILAEEN